MYRSCLRSLANREVGGELEERCHGGRPEVPFKPPGTGSRHSCFCRRACGYVWILVMERPLLSSQEVSPDDAASFEEGIFACSGSGRWQLATDALKQQHLSFRVSNVQ